MTETNPPVKLRPEILALPPYAQGRPPAEGGYKLSSNENPFDPLPGVLDAVQRSAAVNRYPDSSAAAVTARLAAQFGLAPDAVHVAAGSVSLLYQFTQAAAGAGDEVVYAWRSFEAYPGMVLVSGATSVPVPNGPGERHDIDGILAAVTDRTRLVIVCSPNNPTGAIVTAAEFERLMAALPDDLLVILDEAYHEFVTDPQAVNGFDYLQDGRPRYPNLVVLRTFSKAYGLAGLRIGYAVGAPALLAAARATAIPLQVTDAAQQAALASLDARDALFERVTEITVRRDALVAGLRALGLQVPDAQGNFVWIPFGDETVAIAERFDAAGLAVRAFAGDGIRISVGEHESVDLLLRISGEIVRDLPSDHRAVAVR